MKTIVVIPTYNEAENIVNLVAKIKKYLLEAEILFVDDNSTDATRLIIKKLQLRASGG